MPNIRVDLNGALVEGQTVTFQSPAACAEVTGLNVYYTENGIQVCKTFQFADAHGHNVGSVDLFAAGVLVKVILHLDTLRAYVQNADTNAYLEAKFASLESQIEEGVCVNLGDIRTESELTSALETAYAKMRDTETRTVCFLDTVVDYRYFGVLSRSSANWGSFVGHSPQYYGSEIVKHKVGGEWLDRRGQTIRSGTGAPVGGNNGDIYIQIGAAANAAQILHSAYISGTMSKSVEFSNGMYLVTAHTTANNNSVQLIVYVYSGTLYYTAIKTSDSFTVTTSGQTMTMAVKYGTWLSVVKLS